MCDFHLDVNYFKVQMIKIFQKIKLKNIFYLKLQIYTCLLNLFEIQKELNKPLNRKQNYTCSCFS